MGWKEVQFNTFTTSRIIILATSVTEEVSHNLEYLMFGSQESRDPLRLRIFVMRLLESNLKIYSPDGLAVCTGRGTWLQQQGID
ncbi:hypothetical protein RND71_017742 [Anisodus tanguticus]|uniref:Uncharacterized protein n=1 Tax=Anisodus tanguticus TaxID=243964 RepID=A0AAE1VGA3_9SOLA|nr:hypothetical protein RND71_017742 [Anisodus tanguticus]